jgi:N-acetyl-gamma-glutamyl-phosphate reductase common form
MPDPGAIPVVVLGGSGYVAGELLRLLSIHPRFQATGVVSSGHAGERVATAFPHLDGSAADGLAFERFEQACERLRPGEPVGVFAATPHGTTAELLDAFLSRAENVGAPARAVDLSADFRLRDPETFAAIYGKRHGAPSRLASFVCALPEHRRERPPSHAAQPGCFTTATVLPVYPLLEARLCEGPVFVSAITGSSGSGRLPSTATHHPERRSNVRAYAPLTHRHEVEMRQLLAPAAGGEPPEVEFVPHSGPFARGIHATVRLTLRERATADEAVEVLNAYYGERSFVSASTSMPSLTEVVGTNRCRIGVATRDRTLVATSVIDNLVKGAAGGGVQWMNRLFGLDDAAGLRLAGLGWY